jgi:hypothetical protein
MTGDRGLIRWKPEGPDYAEYSTTTIMIAKEGKYIQYVAVAAYEV